MPTLARVTASPPVNATTALSGAARRKTFSAPTGERGGGFGVNRLKRLTHRRNAAAGLAAKSNGHREQGERVDEDHQKRLIVQRGASNQAELATSQPVVRDALRSPGEPLKPATRAVMESRFNHSFSRVRAHPVRRKAAPAKLAVNRRADEFEQEAEDVAEQIMRPPPIYFSPVKSGRESQDFSQ